MCKQETHAKLILMRPDLPDPGARIEVTPETEGRRPSLVDPILEESFAWSHSVDQVQHAVIQSTDKKYAHEGQNLKSFLKILFKIIRIL